MGYPDKKERLTMLTGFLFDITFIAGMICFIIEKFDEFLWITLPGWLIFGMYVFYDWFKIDREARNLERLILTSGNEEIENEEEEFLFYGIGIEEMDEIKIDPIEIEMALNSKELRTQIFDGISNKLKESFKNDILKFIDVKPNFPDTKFESNQLIPDIPENQKLKAEAEGNKIIDAESQNVQLTIQQPQDIDDKEIIDELIDLPQKILSIGRDQKIDLEIDFSKKKKKLGKNDVAYVSKFNKEHINFKNFSIDDCEVKKGKFHYFYNKEIKYLKEEKSINTIEDLRKADPNALGNEMNAKFKFRQINLPRLIQDLEKDVETWVSKYMSNLTDDGRAKFIKIRETPLFKLYYNFYIYKIRFDREIPIIYQDNEEDSEIMWTNISYIILPQEKSKSLFFRSRRIPYKGYWIRCAHVAKMEWVFRSLILNKLPVHFVNSCYYTRKRIQKDMKIDNDRLLLAEIAILTDLYVTLQKDKRTIEKQNRAFEKKLMVVQEQEEFELGLQFATQNPDDEEKRYQADWKPTKTIKALKWVIVGIIVMCFVFGSILGYLIAYMQYQEVLTGMGTDIITG